MRKMLTVVLTVQLFGCTATPTPVAASIPVTGRASSTPSPALTATPAPILLTTLAEGCNASGTVKSAELPRPASAETYSYRVYMPPCYEAHGKARYPVLYLIPGSKSSPDSWLKAGLPREMDRLILSRIIPPMIMVTTQNTDPDPSGEIIHEELVAHVASEYPIAEERQYRAVAGGSLGGISAYQLAFRHPEAFSSAGLFGAGLIAGQELQVRLWLAGMDEPNRTRVFMNTGTEDPYMLERARAMKALLDSAGIENELYVDDAKHDYKAWIPNFERYLTWLSMGW